MAKTRTIVRYRAARVPTRRARGSKMTIPLAVVAGFVPLATFALEGYQVGGITNAGARIAQRLTGYDSTHRVFIPGELVKGWGPIIVGILAHKVAVKLGINAALARSGIPLARL